MLTRTTGCVACAPMGVRPADPGDGITARPAVMIPLEIYQGIQDGSRR
jgi:hypothetical protein